MAVHAGVPAMHGSPRFARDDDWKSAGSWPACNFGRPKQATRNDDWKIGGSWEVCCLRGRKQAPRDDDWKRAGSWPERRVEFMGNARHQTSQSCELFATHQFGAGLVQVVHHPSKFFVRGGQLMSP